MEHKSQADHNLEIELLKKIKTKEEEIEKSIQEAQSKTSQQVEIARKTAKENLEKSLKKAQEEAEKYKTERRKALTLQTEEILSEAKKESEKLLKQAQQNTNNALQVVLSSVLPKHTSKASKEKLDILSEASS